MELLDDEIEHMMEHRMDDPSYSSIDAYLYRRISISL
jgi:hypothetical protein